MYIIITMFYWKNMSYGPPRFYFSIKFFFMAKYIICLLIIFKTALIEFQRQLYTLFYIYSNFIETR